MVLGDAQLDVGGSQQSEDVRLQHCDEDLEEREGESSDEGEHAEAREGSASLEEEEVRGREAEDSRRWPTSRLNVSRSVRLTGRAMNVDTISIGVTRMYMGLGTPAGKSSPLRYANPPFAWMPAAIMTT